MKPIWLVDDDASIRFVLEKALQKSGMEVRSFSNPRDVLSAFAEGCPQVLISDIRMPGGNGIDLLQQIRQSHPGLPVIIMTAYSDLDSAVASLQGGAFDYLSKPFDVDKAVELIQRAVDESLREEQADEAHNEAPELLGQAPAMQDVFRAIGRLAHSQVTVLITGESGSGKELVARALHKHSPRSGGPFVAINTAAIPKDLLESELFGHERGAFTGAQTLRRGRFEQAEGGTLFLDEIGDMPLELQTRLLRVLSDGHYYRVGGHSAIKSHVRVIAATHQNLEQRVTQGQFREDLFHRLNVIRLRLPALRERSEDIAPLTKHFLQRSAQELGVEAKRISAEALRVLQQFPFPGNVRQLENLCQWLTVMAPAQTIQVKDLPDDVKTEVRSEQAPMPAVAATASADIPFIAASNPDSTAIEPSNEDWEHRVEQVAQGLIRRGEPDVMHHLTQRFERAVIAAALAQTHGRRIEAAQKLGIGRNTITRKIQELGMEE
ncbi:fused DNA-binding response regulator in two-component regulatory system with GlnL: response regulator; sigma54 interaction protein [Thiomonas arsenitoxydans]|jgi:two-component system nitrogen regulation response regulator GlnG|uniref:DNA-binding transcriptional regulator NtrC n=2 Tax=Thiomonas TaxID=32012 RepID=D6CT68_THIA3|nr:MULTISPECIES: nitrogen regulation protein NR(I) [Thiomonas]OZB73404.1 MAG: nitrogen regulation protein NR(I) [Thiomonas sp. 14-64-326]CAZ88487.1 Nitrogen regulation protein NR(I) [Thiomonas arsenitoxydans]CQR33078.1 fused DNA-binding response regulator in two-component regulatory system with GlnL: response regulator; sigma54 interaction protein [Thiomonas arsenitoxydans]CQR33788.1 fused DNA-binding response regulator in two-component regulatory system with GlnL: response regulator; sigma54 i